MAPKSTNLRFLLALGNTKIVVLQDATDLHVYSKTHDKTSHQKGSIVPEHVAEALISQ